MPITIKKQNGDIKFYGNHSEPIITIYNGENIALLNYNSISDINTAMEISDAVMISSLFVNAVLTKNTKHFKVNDIEAMYINQGDLSVEETLYSCKKILNWIESDKIVTVNKRERIRYKFTKFAYQNGKLVILYKPVVW